MSEARALMNFAGNAAATVVIGASTDEFDRDQADRVLRGGDPFDEATMLDREQAAADASAAPAPPADRDLAADRRAGPVDPVWPGPAPAAHPAQVSTQRLTTCCSAFSTASISLLS